jgi:hypothetical protein
MENLKVTIQTTPAHPVGGGWLHVVLFEFLPLLLSNPQIKYICPL